jgi:hypothetical protein
MYIVENRIYNNLQANIDYFFEKNKYCYCLVLFHLVLYIEYI